MCFHKSRASHKVSVEERLDEFNQNLFKYSPIPMKYSIHSTNPVSKQFVGYAN